MANPRYAIGLDLGDGESAIAWSDREGTGQARAAVGPDAWTTAPGRIRAYARAGDETSVVTAIARVGNERVIGERALRLPNAREILTNFKTMPRRTGVGLVEPLDSAEFAYWFVKEFAEQHPDIAAPDNCVLYVGHPAGWPPEAVRIYAEQLEARLRPLEVRLVPESQSAFLHVHDEAEVAVDVRPVLVVDIGSSTTDFTLVTDAGADNLPFGQDLGCRAIDEEVMAAVTAAVLDPHDRRRLGQDDEKALLRWLCRRHKEAAFAGVQLPKPELEERGAWVVETCWNRLSEVDVAGLAGRPDGWRDKARVELAAVCDHLGQSRRPALVLTTGGGSRMPFVRDLCVATFPDSQVASIDQPSLAVAKGLASYGRWRARVDAFREGVKRLAGSAALTDVLEAGIVEFTAQLYRAWIDWSFGAGRGSSTGTPDDLDGLKLRQGLFLDWLTTPEGKQTRDRIFCPFELKLDNAIAPEAEALCTAAGLPSSALSTRIVLPPDVFVLPQGVMQHLNTFIERVVDPIFDPAMDKLDETAVGRAVAKFSDWLLPPSRERLLAQAISVPGTRWFRFTDDDKAKLVKAIQAQVSEQLLERSRAIEQLLA
ncbi:Hsp70 family protein [Flindersiella endophytica]